MQTKNLISQPGAMNTYEKVRREGREEEGGEMSRLTERNDDFTAKYRLVSNNDCITSPYGSYDLFYEITFDVIPALGRYEDIGTVEECRKAMKFWRMAKELGRLVNGPDTAGIKYQYEPPGKIDEACHLPDFYPCEEEAKNE